VLRLLLLRIDALVGPTIAPVAAAVYAIGAVVLVLALAHAWFRIWFEWATARSNLTRGWIAPCPTCRQRRPVEAGYCAQCGARLAVPWPLRWRILAGGVQRPRRLFARLFEIVWMATVSFVCILIVRQEALAPEGVLQRFFAGLGMASLAWCVLASGRLLSSSTRGLVSRITSPVRFLAAFGATAITLFLADQAHPIKQKALAQFSVTEAGARIGNRVLPLENNEIAVEYLELEHARLGWHYVIPLAITGKESQPLQVDRSDRWIADFLRAHRDVFESHGLLLHERTDKRPVLPGSNYEIDDVAGQVGIRRIEP
jgi:hypothetical protein